MTTVPLSDFEYGNGGVKNPWDVCYQIGGKFCEKVEFGYGMMLFANFGQKYMMAMAIKSLFM